MRYEMDDCSLTGSSLTVFFFNVYVMTADKWKSTYSMSTLAEVFYFKRRKKKTAQISCRKLINLSVYEKSTIESWASINRRQRMNNRKHVRMKKKQCKPSGFSVYTWTACVHTYSYSIHWRIRQRASAKKVS